MRSFQQENNQWSLATYFDVKRYLGCDKHDHGPIKLKNLEELKTILDLSVLSGKSLIMDGSLKKYTEIFASLVVNISPENYFCLNNYSLSDLCEKQLSNPDFFQNFVTFVGLFVHPEQVFSFFLENIQWNFNECSYIKNRIYFCGIGLDRLQKTSDSLWARYKETPTDEFIDYASSYIASSINKNAPFMPIEFLIGIITQYIKSEAQKSNPVNLCDYLQSYFRYSVLSQESKIERLENRSERLKSELTEKEAQLTELRAQVAQLQLQLQSQAKLKEEAAA